MKTAVLIGAILLLTPCWLVAAEPARPVVGAIRWDAWTGGGITTQVERTLGPQKYHHRLPWFAELLGDDKVRINGGTQAVMDQEIDFAAQAGLDYWAFLLYPEADSMSDALRLYLKSSTRRRINFCVILHNAFSVSATDWPRERDRAIALLREPGYQTVPGGRPLVFAFETNNNRLAEFRQAANTAGVNPYCVLMGWNPAADFKQGTPLGFDAVSAYAYGGDDPSFVQLCQRLEMNGWDRAATDHVPYVPLVTTGWDKQPRKENPVSWEKNQAYHQQTVFPSTATPQEIASHLERAVKFVGEHRDICVANAIIIYAWNEHDEGGWLVPTWTANNQPNAERLEAIRRVLKRNTNSETSPAGSVSPGTVKR